MILYNVTVNLEKEIVSDWIKWIKEEHGPEIIATGCFDFFELWHIKNEEEEYNYAVKYFTSSTLRYEKYISDFAQTMRDKGFERFGNRFIAFRTLLESV